MQWISCLEIWQSIIPIENKLGFNLGFFFCIYFCVLFLANHAFSIKFIADFYFVAPELQKKHEIVEFHGFTRDDLAELPKPIPLPEPMIDMLLKNDLFIRTSKSSVAKVIKQFIIPKKAVRSAKSAVRPTDARASAAKKSKAQQRYNPLPTSNSEVRRSSRLAEQTARRVVRSMSMS